MSNRLSAAILSGLLAGSVACGSSEAPKADAPAKHDAHAKEATKHEAPKEATHAAAKTGDQATKYAGNACHGKNMCKGLGGCAVKGANSCKGKNDCKGKGGCKISGEEQAKFAAKMAAEKAH